MLSLAKFSIVLCLLLAVTAERLLAQFDYSESSTDPRIRRANREKAVAAIGPEARDFVETYGEDAVAVIFACSEAAVMKLIEFHRSGEMGKLPRPLDLLRVIAKPRHGDDVAVWAVLHAHELITDADSFDVYLNNPLEYALGLKSLKAGAAEARAKRLNAADTNCIEGKESPWSWDSLPEKTRRAVGAGVVVAGLIGIVKWRKRRLARDLPA